MNRSLRCINAHLMALGNSATPWAEWLRLVVEQLAVFFYIKGGSKNTVNYIVTTVFVKITCRKIVWFNLIVSP